MAKSPREKVIQYLLLGLIAGFFLIPLTVYCLFDCRIILPKRAASLLLFFFR